MNIRKFTLYLSSALCTSMLYCCSENNQPSQYKDPVHADTISENSIKQFGDEFTTDTLVSHDGYKLISITHNCSAYTEYYKLNTPNGHLRLLATGSQETCGLTGHIVDYNDDGSVANVIYIGLLDDNEYNLLTDSTLSVKVMKKWSEKETNDPYKETYNIVRNNNKEVIKIGNINVPSGYKAKYYLGEWGPFWSHDIDGGAISFFVKLECLDKEGSYVDYLYADNKLIAELAHWNGKLIKFRTYNNRGALVNQYSDRNLDVLDQAFYDYNETTKWYIDE